MLVTMNVTWGIRLLLTCEFLGYEVERCMAGSRTTVGTIKAVQWGVKILWHCLPSLLMFSKPSVHTNFRLAKGSSF